MKILIYGYGNPGRQDDGLGVCLADRIALWASENNLVHIDTDSNYQLNIEDAEKISRYDAVFFCDASVEDISDFALTNVTAEDSGSTFTTHSASPSFIFDLCEKLFHKSPQTFLLHIKGYEWEFSEGISENAMTNLIKAEAFLKEKILLLIN